MKFKDVAAIIDGIPDTDLSKGKNFYDFVMESRPKQCLELGFAHGVSSCYFAAALQELGPEHHLTCIDLNESAALQPNLETLLQKCNLTDKVTIVRVKSSYTWFLKRKIEEQSKQAGGRPIYDFCFIDGPKSWTIDDAAFFMVDKLLRENAWLAFDDYAWTYRDHQKHGHVETDGISHRELEHDEFEEPHVEAIFRLLVMQHPSYSNFKVEDNVLAWAQKKKGDQQPRVSFESSMSFKYKFVALAKQVMGRVRG